MRAEAPATPAREASVYDPLGYDLPLPLKARYYPVGYPLDLVTNSEDVLRAANYIWGQFPPSTWQSDAATLRVIVDDRDALLPPVASMPRGQNHLVSFVHGPDNFAVCDLARSFTFACLTQDVASDASYIRYHFLEPAGYLMVDAAHLCPVHASCVSLNGRAMLLCGDAGAGKTSLAYACARNGWTYLSDDATHIVRASTDYAVAGRPFRIRFRESGRKLFPELSVFTPELRPNGKLDIEVETSALGIATAFESHASHVVFLNRRPDVKRAEIRMFARCAALDRLSQLICYGDARIRSEQSRALADFLQLPIVELGYRDLDDAEQTLRALAGGAA
ncbi:MAG TPA: hypothetical protein VHW24_23640 [Bryobacteraceae bacterium]|nr:hypothetical protein [Bryobacteraceae bacterium]